MRGACEARYSRTARRNRMSICSKRGLGEVHPVIFLFGKMVSSCSKRDAYEAHVAFRQGREKTRNKLK